MQVSHSSQITEIEKAGSRPGQPVPALVTTPSPILKRKPWKRFIALGLVLGISLALRVFALDWGIPNYTADLLQQTTYRHSYHYDEVAYLLGLSQMHPDQGNYDVHEYRWGTLQLYLIAGALSSAELGGVLPTPWTAAFAHPDRASLVRIYSVARLVSVIAGVLATLLVITLATLLGSYRAGLAAGVAYAVAPIAVVEGHYLTGDVTSSMLVTAGVLALVLAVQRKQPHWLIGAGLLLGLAMAAKYSAVVAVAPLLVAQIGVSRLIRGSVTGIERKMAAWRRHAGSTLGRVFFLPWLAVALGFILGEPSAVIAPAKVFQGLKDATGNNAPSLADGVVGLFKPLGLDFYYLGALGFTWPLTLLALGGLGLLIIRNTRRPHTLAQDEGHPVPVALLPSGIIIVAVEALVLGLALNRNPMLRYSQPLIPLLAVAAGLAWAAIPGAVWRRVVGGVAITWAVVGTLGQLALFMGPHPVDLLQTWLEANLKPGQQVAEMWPDAPALDPARYALVEIPPWQPDLPSGMHPDYIIINDMPYSPLSPQLSTVLTQEYHRVAYFSARPHIGDFTWDEGPTSHDWKYNHPVVSVYARGAATLFPPHERLDLASGIYAGSR